jgi:hypothetical protein
MLQRWLLFLLTIALIIVFALFLTELPADALSSNQAPVKHAPVKHAPVKHKTLEVYRIRHYNEPKSKAEHSPLSNRNAADLKGEADYLTTDYCYRFNRKNMSRDKIYHYKVIYTLKHPNRFGVYIRCNPADGYHGHKHYVCDARNTTYCHNVVWKITNKNTNITAAQLSKCPPTGAHGEIGREAAGAGYYWYSFPLSAECAPKRALGYRGCRWKFVAILNQPVGFYQLKKAGFKCDAYGSHLQHNIKVLKHVFAPNSL